MAGKKETKKRTVLPAIGKPKPKKPKSSVRELGVKANKAYKEGEKATTRPTFGPKKGKEIPEREFGAYRLDKRYGYDNDPAKYDPTYTGPGKKPKVGPKGYYEARRIMARQTGV